jgi:hypothetical protein
MGWERRWKEILLAGGALSAAACGETTTSTGTQADAAEEDDGMTLPFIPCCNVNPDPCCPLGCQDANSPDYLSCEVRRNTCESAGGSYNYLMVCTFPADAGLVDGPADAGVETSVVDGASDAGPADAAGDGDAHD